MSFVDLVRRMRPGSGDTGVVSHTLGEENRTRYREGVSLPIPSFIEKFWPVAAMAGRNERSSAHLLADDPNAARLVLEPAATPIPPHAPDDAAVLNRLFGLNVRDI